MEINRRPTLGFIGLGTMGGPMAARLASAGHRVLAYDLSAPALQRVRERGCIASESVLEVANGAEVIFACLPSPQISREVAFGDQGISSGTAVRVYVETSTVGPEEIEEIARRLAVQNIATVDAPVSGGRHGAESGELSMMIAGPRAATESIDPFARVLARDRFVVGESAGMAQLCKLINNAISITGTTIVCEAIAMGMKAGLDPAVLIDVLNASSGRNTATVKRFPSFILPRTFNSGTALAIPAKDIQLYLQQMKRLDAPSPVGSAVAQVYERALISGGPHQDSSRIMCFFEQCAGIADGKADDA